MEKPVMLALFARLRILSLMVGRSATGRKLRSIRSRQHSTIDRNGSCSSV